MIYDYHVFRVIQHRRKQSIPGFPSLRGLPGVEAKPNLTIWVWWPSTLTTCTAWAWSLLRRMNFSKRPGTTTCKSRLPPLEFKHWKHHFYKILWILWPWRRSTVPPELVINWDQTGLNLVPVAPWTMASKGSKCAEVKGLENKRQITSVLCASIVEKFYQFNWFTKGKQTDATHHTTFPWIGT